MATPNYSVCACTVIGNRYILWSYSSTQLGKWYGIIFLCDISPFINAPLKVEEVFALFPTSSQNQKPLESWESWDLTWLDSLTWIINKTLPPCPHHVGSRQCPPVSGLASAPLLSAVSPSLFAAHALSVRSALKLAVVIMIRIQWLQMPPIKTTVQVIWDKMTGSCHRGT